MILNINGRDLTVRNDLRAITEKRIAKLDKFFDSNAEVNVIYSKKRNLQIAEITVFAKGTIFRSEVDGETFNNSLDEAIENIAIEEDFDLDEPETEIRVKSFPVKPMTTEEAIMQMNLLGHMFFVFRDAGTMDICVVYKRKDGAYGLIVPQ